MLSFQDVVFWVLAVTSIGAALGVVLVRDLFRSALLLALVFVAVAGFFVLLSAEFLAVAQTLIYVGAISILFIFAVMLSKNVRQSNLPNRLQIPATLFPALLLVILIAAVLGAEWRPIPEEERSKVELAQTRSVSIIAEETLVAEGFDTVADRGKAQQSGLADLIIGTFVLPFEAVSLLLLAALIGGLALARSRGGQSQ